MLVRRPEVDRSATLRLATRQVMASSIGRRNTVQI
jgi:hypothetical protein